MPNPRLNYFRYATKGSSIPDNISAVVDAFLCTSCGACAGLCPRRAIKMQLSRLGNYLPVIDKSHCNQCGLCIRVCPGHGFDYEGHYIRLHGALPEHVALGVNLAGYAGYTTDKEILHISQSGGFVSTLLLFCLDEGIIDGAIVTKTPDDAPFSTDTYLATNKREILAAVGSKYSPVPALQNLDKLLNKRGRFAFVGTACQIQGLRNAELAFPKLAEKMALYIGLHCLGVFTNHFHSQMLHKINVPRRNIAYFRHKDKAWRGWTCDMRMADRKGRVYDIDRRNSRLWPRPFFTNWRCQLCFDKANEFSDVSCGDCRIPSVLQEFERNGYNLSKGLSEFVIRTERGNQIVTKALSRGRIVAKPVDSDALARSIGVAGKKIGTNTFSNVARLFRVGVPEYGVQFSAAKLETSKKWRLMKTWSVLASTRYFLTFFLGQHEFFRQLLKRVPHKIFGKLDNLFESQVEWAVFRTAPRLLRILPHCTKKKRNLPARREVNPRELP